MAVCLEMNRGHISDIERGKRKPGIITLQVIATVQWFEIQDLLMAFTVSTSLFQFLSTGKGLQI